MVLDEIAYAQPDNFKDKQYGEKPENVAGAPHRQKNMGNGAVFRAVLFGKGGEGTPPPVQRYCQAIEGDNGHGRD